MTATSLSAHIGARLREIRTERGLSLGKVRALSGKDDLSEAAVGSWERGDREVPLARLEVIAALYGVPVTDLLPKPDSLTYRGLAAAYAQMAEVRKAHQKALDDLTAKYETALDDLREQVHACNCQRRSA